MTRIATLAVACLAAWAVASPARAEPRALARPQNLATLYPDIYAERPVIELVTMGVGELIWERHGHIALCVREVDPREDHCFNYGIGDFGNPIGMAWGFLRATGAFWVGKMPYVHMLSFYMHADRTVWVQPLRLTADQKRDMIAKLEHDILDENRHYAYDHFLDNCTTRVRDVIDAAIGGKLAAMTGPVDDHTFRDYAREGFFGMPVPLLVTDFAMGRVTDRVPSYFERMFLPQYLREAMAKLSGVEPVAVYTRQGPPPSTDPATGRGWLALVILILTAPAWLIRRRPRLGLGLAVAPYALLGAALWFVAIVSPLGYMRWNELCLVVLPVDLALVFLSAERRQRYARARLVMLGAIALLSLVGVLKQPLLTPLLWPLIPLAVAGLLPDRSARPASSSTSGKPAKPKAGRAAALPVQARASK